MRRADRAVKAALGGVIERIRRSLGIERLEHRLHALNQRVTPLISTWPLMNWIEHAVLPHTPLVSVIMPTRNRSTLLPRAVDAIRAQAYPHWELVVIDDGSTDETPQRLQQLARELGAARNGGLAAARGSLIAYADDDNIMHPLWLKTVVWAFSLRPDVDVVYGGFIVDDVLRVNQKDSGALPSYHLFPFDREHLAHGNL